MKHRKKGQSSPSKRSRSREDAALAPAPANVADASQEESSLDSVSPAASQGIDALAAPVEVAAVPVAQPAAEAKPATARVAAAPARDLRPRAEQIVQDHLPLAVGAGMIPLPGLDLAAIGGLQLKVLSSLAEHYGVPFTRAQAQLIVTSLLGSVGTTFLAGAVIVSAAKLMPFFGTLVGAASMPVAGGVITRAMGHLAIDHFEAGGTMETFDLDLAQAALLAKIAEAKAALA